MSTRLLLAGLILAGGFCIVLVKRRSYVVLLAAFLSSACVTVQPDYRPTKPDLRPAPPEMLVVRAAVVSRMAL